MNLTLEQETPPLYSGNHISEVYWSLVQQAFRKIYYPSYDWIPLYQDQTGAIRVGNSRVLLELVIRAFQDGLSPESIVSRYSTLSLSDVYNAIAYYLRHQQTVETYLQEREQLAELVRERLMNLQPDLQMIRARLLSQQQ
jgi:uncharacterized protein (DUF433 family)